MKPHWGQCSVCSHRVVTELMFGNGTLGEVGPLMGVPGNSGSIGIGASGFRRISWAKVLIVVTAISFRRCTRSARPL